MDSFLSQEIGCPLNRGNSSPLLEDRLTQYETGRESIDEFRTTLEGLAADVAKENNDLPLVVMIDELDRCRPSYAVELLEVAKHLFSVDGIIFVLSLDRAQLAHSVRSIYGNEFGASGYLRRFFDIDYRLPDPDTGAFVDAAFDSIGLDAFYARTKDQEARSLSHQLSELMKRFFGTLDVSLRDVEQAIHRLGLVLATLPDDKKMFGLTAGVLLVLRAWRPELYRDFVDGRSSAEKIVGEVFAQQGMGEVQDRTHVDRLFEAVLIVGECEQKGGSELLDLYRELAKRDVVEGAPEASASDHAGSVLGIVEPWGAQASDGGVGLKYTVHRLELLSPELPR